MQELSFPDFMCSLLNPDAADTEWWAALHRAELGQAWELASRRSSTVEGGRDQRR
jgi:hypothetical protein